jgi:hypothetical protein
MGSPPCSQRQGREVRAGWPAICLPAMRRAQAYLRLAGKPKVATRKARKWRWKC